MLGKITSLDEVKMLKQGTTSKGRDWTLWGTKVGINGEDLSITNFDKVNVENMIKDLAVGETVDYKTKTDKGYTNITELMLSDTDYTPPEPKAVEGIDFEKELDDLIPVTNEVLSKLMENTAPEFVQTKLQVFFELMKEKGLYERTRLIQSYKMGNMKSFKR